MPGSNHSFKVIPLTMKRFRATRELRDPVAFLSTLTTGKKNKDG